MFVDSLKETLNEDFNYSTTENGALGYRTTGKELLDLNFAVASLRSANEQDIINRFMKAFYENKTLALKWLFYIRDIRGGLGERRTFRVILNYLSENQPDIIEKLIELVPEYGRYDDLWGLLSTNQSGKVIQLIREQLRADLSGAKEDKPISLLAKWLPSPCTSSKETVKQARQIAKALGMEEKEYRKTLSRLRKYLDVVEVKMSAKKWGDINYEAVPSRANLIYNSAFLRNDEQRRKEFLSKLEKGEAKINSSVLFPHDIVHNYLHLPYGWYQVKPKDATLEAMWVALPDLVQGTGNTIVVADGSGSMMGRIGESNVTALDVANSLAIYFAERSSGEFKDKYITFSAYPQLVDLSGGLCLRDKIEIALRYNEVANTNIEKVFDLVLQTAINKKMNQEDLPTNILIISDMEFDEGVSGLHNQRLFETIADKYAQKGYRLPRLIFWNVASRTGTIPIKQNALGVALVSGFSPNIVKMVMSSEFDPFKCLLEVLNSERYAPIEKAIA